MCITFLKNQTLLTLIKFVDKYIKSGIIRFIMKWVSILFLFNIVDVDIFSLNLVKLKEI